MDFVTVDALGRILLPKGLRDEMHLKAGSRLLAANLDGKLLLKPMDLKALAKQMHDELKGVDIDTIARNIRAEANREAADSIARILARHQHPGGGDPAPSSRHRKPSTSRSAPRRP